MGTTKTKSLPLRKSKDTELFAYIADRQSIKPLKKLSRLEKKAIKYNKYNV